MSSASTSRSGFILWSCKCQLTSRHFVVAESRHFVKQKTLSHSLLLTDIHFSCTGSYNQKLHSTLYIVLHLPENAVKIHNPTNIFTIFVSLPDHNMYLWRHDNQHYTALWEMHFFQQFGLLVFFTKRGTKNNQEILNNLERKYIWSKMDS